jgi:NAD(P)-dependent dehydrogenase (short-subunit alcohol dehydrogenase family)
MANPTQGTVLLTGASGGIGAAVAALLADRGYAVYAGVHRTPSTTTPNVIPVEIDVTDPHSVAKAAETVRAAVGTAGLQAVINNAGVIVQGPLELIPPDELRRQFDINTLGCAYVCQSFLPLLRAGGGRIVNITAPTARVPVPFLAALSGSKAALASMSEALRTELSPWQIPVVVVEPGGTRTEIFAKADRGAENYLAHTDSARVELYRTQLAAVAAATAKMTMGPIEPVAATVVKAVTARNPKRRYSVGTGSRTFGVLAHLPSPLRERAVASAYGLTKARER